MSNQIIVIDANIVVKVLHDETDSAIAQDFLKACVKRNARLIVPEHFTYELMNVALRLGVDIAQAFDLQTSLKDTLLTFVTPQKPTWLLAAKISKHGHSKSGFPSLYDSIYHALAIEAQGIFITADKRHVAKAESFESVMLLKDWETLWQE